MSQTLLDKIWSRHVVTQRDDGTALLYVDRHLMHEGSRSAFAMLATTKRDVARPRLSFAFADHMVPTVGQSRGIEHIANEDARTMARTQVANCSGAGIELFGIDHPGQGIVHVAAPEQGLTLPGLLIVCGDSHTSTHGAFGALAFGIGASEVAHVLATQTLWQRRPRNLLVRVSGGLPAAVFAKDLALALIARIGAAGATEQVIEFAGEAIAGLSMEARMTLCNMSIEAGARAGLIAPDDKTLAYLRGRRYAPDGAAWDRAEQDWRQLASDPDAVFDAEVALDAADVVPMTTWGTSPEDAVPLTGVIPAPEDTREGGKRERMVRALDYMGLRPGQAIRDVQVDHVFIGSCTNSRIEDLRLVARLVEGRRAVVPTMVVPGSRQVRAQAEAEGLDQVFRAAGLDWRDPGCSMCLGMNGDVLGSGQRCASTSNRNFEGRQGKGVRTHLVSPATAAATAVFGRLTDPRELDAAGGAR